MAPAETGWATLILCCTREIGRVVECTGLENRRTLIAFPGFESLVSRQDLHKSLAKAGLLRFWGKWISSPVSAGVPQLMRECSITCLLCRLRGRSDPPVNPLRDFLLAMPQQWACIPNIEDFRRRFVANVPKLNPGDLGCKQWVALVDRLQSSQAQHPFRHPFFMPVDQQVLGWQTFRSVISLINFPRLFSPVLYASGSSATARFSL